MEITARVTRDPQRTPEAETVTLSPPAADEVVVKVESAGICATDIHAGSLVDAGLLKLPVVLGHEAAGIVVEVGSGVSGIAVGDRVALVFDSCGQCRSCNDDAPSYCEEFNQRNFGTQRTDGTTALSVDGETLGSHFLGQSSFATHAVATERSVVKLPDDVDLAPVGPFGCGFLTGAGAVLNELRPEVGSSIAVFGAGPVGLAAIMAARIAGCAEIIAVDLSSTRLAVAAEVGATTLIDASEGSAVEEIRKVVPGGVDFSLDTTGSRRVVHDAVESLTYRGRCGIVGVAADQDMTLQWRTLLGGRSVIGITSGSADPQVLLPQLVEHFRAGRFPVDRFITYYPFADFEHALNDVREGRAIKAVLTF